MNKTTAVTTEGSVFHSTQQTKCTSADDHMTCFMIYFPMF